MRCVTIMDGRFTLSGGVPASHHMNYDSFCRHFLEVFDELVVVGRLFETEDVTAKPVTGPGVSFIPIPAYAGPEQFLAKAREIFDLLTSLIKPDTVFLLRVPGTIPLIFSIIAKARGVPFCVQCVADPADQLGAGSVRHPLRRFFRTLFVRGLKWQCRQAAAAMYVTREALQRGYPPNPANPRHNYTDLVLDDAAIVLEPRPAASFNPDHPVVVNVGMMIQLYKGQDTLIEAAKICSERGLPIEVRLVGDGPFRSELEALAERLGMSANVKFLGKLPGGAAVREQIDQCDIFALPSRQEGLPRALMEAMARGAPAVGSTVGGIPELLDAPDLVPPDDAAALAGAIIAACASAASLAQRSQRNLNRAGDYRFAAMKARRIAFYQEAKRVGAWKASGTEQ